MKKIYEAQNIIGCDETGVGDYLSPLVAAAVFVPFQNIPKLHRLGITDSKLMSDRKINRIANQIKPIVTWQVQHLTQQGYNKLNRYLNANELKMFVHLAAINKVEAKVKDAHLIIIDAFAQQQFVNKYMQRLLSLDFNFQPLRTPLELVTRGETEHIAVAAASILARHKLLALMAQQNQAWNTVFPLGTNSKVEAFIVAFVSKHGKDQLEKVAKVKFKTTKKLFG